MEHSETVQGAYAVVNVAAHFTELKLRAQHLRERATAQDRGYFSPEEDLEVQNLLGSYWSARNALLEFLREYQQDRAPDAEPDRAWQHREFVAAFAAALVLVDAARFLREQFHELPLLRGKLNESARELAVPAGCYDQVQASLFGMRHAWHLYHAIGYFQANTAALREVTTDAPFSQFWPIIESLEHRLDIPLSQYTQARLRARGRSIIRRLTLKPLQMAMYGLQKLAGVMLAEKYVRWGHEPSLPSTIRQQLELILRPGDILVVRKEFALTNYFLPGYWPHAALYLGTPQELEQLGLSTDPSIGSRWEKISAASRTDEPLRALESMKDGVHLRPIDSPYRCDSIVVLRLPCGPAEIAEGLSRALKHEGKPYDFSFDFGRADQLVCTEVAYRAFEGVAGMSFPLVRRAGRPTLSGSDLTGLAIDGKVVHPVAVFAPRLSDNTLAVGDACQPILRQAHRA
jgi:hypothetical protein